MNTSDQNKIESEKYYQSGYEKFRKFDRNGALLDQNKAIELDASNFNAFHERAVIKTNLKDIQGAISDFLIAIELNPKDMENYFGLGYAYYLSGNKTESKKYFERAHNMGHSQAIMLKLEKEFLNINLCRSNYRRFLKNEDKTSIYTGTENGNFKRAA